MYGFGLTTLFIVMMILSGVLYFILGLYKRFAYFWWTIGGILICIPIAAIIPKTGKLIWNKSISTEKGILTFLSIYVAIYVILWIFTKRNQIPEAERVRLEKLDEAIFDGFMALKEKRIDEAYRIFKKAYLIDPDNPVINTILSSFKKGKHGLIKKNRFFDWKYKLLLKLKGSKKTAKAQSQTKKIQAEIVYDQDKNKEDGRIEKKVNGKVVE